MKNSFILIPAFLLLPFVINSQEIKFLPSDWENPAIFQKGQTDPHALHIAFDDVAGAMEERFSESKNFLSLNGIWKFKWYEKPELVNLDFSSPGFNTRNWNDIPVPSNWQMEGYGHPKFRNIALSFENNPPYIPDYYNPTACYKRNFNIPSDWKDKEVFLRFEGIKSASYIWINGEKVGYNQGGFEPAEFNISPYVKKGKNDISIEVIRFSDGSYLENQDMWRLSGIYRDVFIYALPKLHIHDFYIVTDLDENYRDAVLRLEIELENQWNTESLCQLEIDVLDNSSNSVLEEAINIKSIGIKGNSRKKIYRETLVKNPAKWSAEFPNLYTLIFQLKDVNGKHLESFSEKLGFREVEIKDEAILINGVPVKFNGVNSHMHHPRFGQAVPVETLKEDLLIMKRFNINCVRTSHYPPSPEYLDLADRIGMYIFDEVGDEAHNNIQLSYDSAWTEMYKDRSRKLVYRDRNHPSVVVWSAGNESGSGFNIDEVIKTGKEIDPGRPGWMYGGNTFLIPFEDITGPRYWEPYLLKNLADKKVLGDNDLRPSFMDEYLAATGNGLGGLDEYWELIYKYPRLTGGAIWDWISPGVETSLWIIPDKMNIDPAYDQKKRWGNYGKASVCGREIRKRIKIQRTRRLGGILPGSRFGYNREGIKYQFLGEAL